MTTRKLLAAHIASVLGMSLAAPAFAADEANKDQDVERLEVIGSHIKRTDVEGANPVLTISRDQIDKSGYNNLQQLLEKMPATGNGTFSTRGNNQDSTANGAAGISLRGFGADATLVLINGRRVGVSSFAENVATSFVDVNNIPVSAIERIEVLKDGASALYGSDAVAGVVNIVLRKDFEGKELNVGYGDTTDTNSQEETVSLVWGFGDDKSNGTLILDYFHNNALMNKDRGELGTANHTGKGLNADYRSSRNLPGRFVFENDPRDPRDNVNLTDPACAATGSDCFFDYAPYGQLIPEAERAGAAFMGHTELTAGVELFTEIQIQHNTSMASGAATPLDEDAELFVPRNHPNFPAQWTNMEPGEPLKIRRYRVMDAGARIWNIESDTSRLLAGLRGQFAEWDWETAIQKGRSESTQSGTKGWVRTDKLQEEINAGRFNPFGGARHSQDVVDAITTEVSRQGESHLTSWDGKLSGVLGETSHGNISMALGFEVRDEDVSDNPDRQFTEGLIYGTEAIRASADREQKSFYTEFLFPLADKFELSLAGRYDDYSDFGSTTNPKVGARWQPVDDVTLRGSWGTGFRAPSLAQIGLGPSDKSDFLVDSYLCAQSQDEVDCSVLDYTFRLTGNQNLEAEESEAWNIGGIWQVNSDLSIGADWWHILQDNKIGELPNQVVYDAECGNQTSTVCEREATSTPGQLGRLIRINKQFLNLEYQEAQGLDITASYNWDLGSNGALKFNLDWTYLDSFEQKLFAGGEVEDLAGEYNYPKYRWVSSVDWTNGDWGVNASVNYTGEFEDYYFAMDADGNLLQDYDASSPTVDSFTTINSQVRYQGFQNTLLVFGVDNLLDEEVPFSNGNGDDDLYGYASGVHNPRGRFVYGKVSYRF